MLRPKEAAAWLGVSTSHLHRLLNKGLIPCIRMGRVIQVEEAALDAYRESCRQVGPRGEPEPEGEVRAASHHLYPLSPSPSRRRS